MNSTLITMRNRRGDLERSVHEKNCHSCGQSIPEEKLVAGQMELKNLLGKIPRIESLYNETNQKMSNIFQYSQVVNNAEIQKNGFTTQLNQLAESLNSESSVDLAELKQQLDSLSDTVNALNEELSTVNSNVENLEYITKLLLPSSQFRSFVLQRFSHPITVFLFSCW